MHSFWNFDDRITGFRETFRGILFGAYSIQAYFLDKIPQPTPTQSWPKVEFSGYLLEFFVKSLEFFRKLLSIWDIFFSFLGCFF